VAQDSDRWTSEQLSAIYRERFSPEEIEFKRKMWRVFVDGYFQRFVGSDDTVLDLGAGNCEFINAIHCGEKIAVDLNPDVEQFAEGSKVFVRPSRSIPEVAARSVDVIFTSNFFEHLPDKTELLMTLEECHRMLRPGGRLMVLMPNIRHLPGRYWDYFDHHLALTQHSLVEALTICGFKPELVRAKTLPYTIKHTRVPHSVFLVRAYVAMRFVWPLLGKQMFVVARRLDD
jgi:SAM-dependent methyltransferase